MMAFVALVVMACTNNAASPSVVPDSRQVVPSLEPTPTAVVEGTPVAFPTKRALLDWAESVRVKQAERLADVLLGQGDLLHSQEVEDFAKMIAPQLQWKFRVVGKDATETWRVEAYSSAQFDLRVGGVPKDYSGGMLVVLEVRASEVIDASNPIVASHFWEAAPSMLPATIQTPTFTSRSTDDGATPQVSLARMTPVASSSSDALSQDEYAERAAGMVSAIGDLEKRTADCNGYDEDDVNERLDEDARYQTAFKASKDLEERMAELRRREGIHISQDFDVRVDRLSDEDWEKINSLATKFVTAMEEVIAAIIAVADDELKAVGC